MKQTMKQLKKHPELYQSSNVQFNTKTLTASSYGWWIFVKKIKGKVVFNDYYYSPTTRKHQIKVRELMETLGYKIDVTVSIKDSLNSLDVAGMTLNQLKKYSDKKVKELTESKRAHRNLMAKQRREKKKLELVANDLMKNNSGCLIVLGGK